MKQHLKSLSALTVVSPALIVSLPARITPCPGMFNCFNILPVNRFTNKLAPHLASNMPKNPPFCSFASFLIVY